MDAWKKPSNVVVLVLLLAAVGFAWWVSQRGDEETGEGEATETVGSIAEPDVLVPMEEGEEVIYIQIDDRLNVRTLTVEKRDDGTWSVFYPEELPADSFGAQFAASTVERLFISRTLSDAEQVNIVGFGVQEPAYVVVVRTSTGSEVRFSIGERLFDGQNYYVLVEDDPNVKIVSSSALDELLGLLDVPPIIFPTLESTPDSGG